MNKSLRKRIEFRPCCGDEGVTGPRFAISGPVTPSSPQQGRNSILFRRLLEISLQSSITLFKIWFQRHDWSIIWPDLTWPDLTWLDLTWPDLTWPDLTWLDLTWFDLIWPDFHIFLITFNEMDLRGYFFVYNDKSSYFIVWFKKSHQQTSWCSYRERPV